MKVGDRVIAKRDVWYTNAGWNKVSLGTRGVVIDTSIYGFDVKWADGQECFTPRDGAFRMNVLDKLADI